MGVLLALFIGAVVAIALAIALAPYILPLLGILAVLAVAIVILILVAGALGIGEARFARWYDNTKLANWVAYRSSESPFRITLVAPGPDDAPHDTEPSP